MSADPAPRGATYDDIIALPENMVGELLNGELVVHPRPAPRHAVAYSALGVLIGGPFGHGIGGPGGWWVLDEPELHLGPDVIVPDLAGWRRERMPVPPDEAWFELPPGWVCEVLSPGTVRHDRITKLGLYGRVRIPWYWLVDPASKTLEVLALQAGKWIVAGSFAGSREIRAVPVEAITLDLRALWID